MIKNVKLGELNISIAAVFLNMQTKFILLLQECVYP